MSGSLESSTVEDGGGGTYEELGVVVLEEGGRLLRGRLLVGVAPREQAHAVVICINVSGSPMGKYDRCAP